jgi:hypothetical protein
MGNLVAETGTEIKPLHAVQEGSAAADGGEFGVGVSDDRPTISPLNETHGADSACAHLLSIATAVKPVAKT